MTTLAASGFVFGAVVMLQGLVAQVLPRQMYLRVSAVLQITVFCLLVSVYILEPTLLTPQALADPANHRMLMWLPSYWFLGLFQQLNGSMQAYFQPLVHDAWIGLGMVGSGTLGLVALSYLRSMRRIAEEPDILPGSAQWPWPDFLRRSAQGAVVLFGVRTLLRSRQHRMLLAFYVGTGGAVSLVLLRLSHKGDATDMAAAWLTVALLTMFEVCVAMRMLVAMPITPRANWVFRMAALDTVAAYARGVRRSFLWMAVMPVLVIFGGVFFWQWPIRVAALYWAELALIGVLLAEACAHGFHKIPFTCTYQPGKAQVQYGIWGIVAGVPLIRLWMKYDWVHLRTPRWTAATIGALLLLVLVAGWSSRSSAEWAENLEFDGFEEPE